MIMHAIGISYRHNSDFRINRPNGSGDNLLVIFKTPAFISINDSEICVPKDSAVIYSKGFPQIYGAYGEPYENHWVHFDCNETDIFFERIGFQFNRPVPVFSITSAENVLEMLSLESVSEYAGENECVDLMLRLLFAKIYGSEEKTKRSVHSERLRKLRADIYSTPTGKFTVESLAEKLSLSPSYFQALYKSEFGVSCYEDVLRAKISLAKYYLENTSLSVRAISEICGYENDVHFIRQFKQRTGMTAVEYRKNKSV